MLKTSTLQGGDEMLGLNRDLIAVQLSYWLMPGRPWQRMEGNQNEEVFAVNMKTFFFSVLPQNSMWCALKLNFIGRIGDVRDDKVFPSASRFTAGSQRPALMASPGR